MLKIGKYIHIPHNVPVTFPLLCPLFLDRKPNIGCFSWKYFHIPRKIATDDLLCPLLLDRKPDIGCFAMYSQSEEFIPPNSMCLIKLQNRSTFDITYLWLLLYNVAQTGYVSLDGCQVCSIEVLEICWQSGNLARGSYIVARIFPWLGSEYIIISKGNIGKQSQYQDHTIQTQFPGMIARRV